MRASRLRALASWSMPSGVESLSGSSVGRGIASRAGSGNFKHSHVEQLWIQDVVKSGRAPSGRLPGLLNSADALTHRCTDSTITVQLVREGVVMRPGLRSPGRRGVSLHVYMTGHVRSMCRRVCACMFASMLATHHVVGGRICCTILACVSSSPSTAQKQSLVQAHAVHVPSGTHTHARALARAQTHIRSAQSGTLRARMPGMHWGAHYGHAGHALRASTRGVRSGHTFGTQKLMLVGARQEHTNEPHRNKRCRLQTISWTSKL